MNSSFSSRVIGRLRFWAHWRCVDPVVVFESDDWGLERRPCTDILKSFGKPSEWADEQLETEEDLEALYGILERHKDGNRRTVNFTANFIAGNPDFEAIKKGGFTRYHDVAIGSQKENLRAKWIEGLGRKVFFPQYHGRSHFWSAAWLQDLQDHVPGSRQLFDQQCNGGLSLIKNEGWRYHSEYIYWKSGDKLSAAQTADWLSVGLDYFQKCFGYFPASTIAPNYIFTDNTVVAWAKRGIQFVQGTNYHIIQHKNGGKLAKSHVLGELLSDKLLCMTRNVKFDPRPQRSQNGFVQASGWINSLFRNKLPVVIDTHRINYVGPWKAKALEELDCLLGLLKSRNARFLTTVELGEAIQNRGYYHDTWTGETRYLPPLDGPFQKMLRLFFQNMERKYANFSTSKLS